MADEFQGGVCGGSWWPTNSSANLFRSSPCSSAINGPGSFGWLNNEPIVDNTKTARSVSDDSAGTASDGSGSIVLQDAQKPSDDQNASIASTLQMMGINLSSSSTTTSDDSWNQNLLHDNGRSEQQNYPNHMLQPNPGFINNNPSMNYDQNSSFNSNFRQDNQSYPFNISASYGYTSPFLFDTNSQPGQQSLLDNNQSSTIYSSCANYMDSSEYIRLPLQKQQPSNNPLQFTNNTPFWNATAADFLPSSRPQLVVASSATGAKPNLHSLSTKQRNQESAGQGLNSAATTKKASNEPSFKRPRIETPSPLPTFKVRKEKLGDRITALQQLVSPFGKTDTASVLHEAIEYIKFLHDQVGVLSTPYLKNGPPHQLQHQQANEKMKDENGQIQDLKSRGLCLVPISTTFPVTAESTTDLWTPTFGGCFR